MGARDWDFDCGDRGVVARSRFEWRTQRFECAPSYRGWRRPRVRDATEYVGRGVARAEAADRVGAHKRRTRHTDAARVRTTHALELPDGAHFVLAVIPDAVLHGRRQPLPVSEHRRAITDAGCSHV